MNQRVESYLLNLPEGLLEKVFAIRKLIMESAPQMEESIKFGIPFYSWKGPLFYFNKKGNGINLGFYHGIHLLDEAGILGSHELKMVRHFYFDQNTEIPVDFLKDLILQSVDINQKKKK